MEKKKYSLLTAISMVVGIVVGSGVFFKSGAVLGHLDGNLPLSIFAWICGGLIMIVSAYTFSLLATKSKSGDLISIANETVGRKYSYLFSWYFGLIYFPIIASVIAWVSTKFLLTFLGIEMSALNSSIISMIFLVVIFGFNILAPKISGKFQISTTTVKLVPLVVMAIGGVIFGLFNSEGVLVENFTNVIDIIPGGKKGAGFFAALTATAFAYEGWIIATSISKELKNAKRNLPIALTIGTTIILLIYLLYYIGLSGVSLNNDLILGGDLQVKESFVTLLFGNKIFGSLLYAFIVVSVIGTLNGVVMGTMRSFKLIAQSDNGPKPEKIAKLNKKDISVLSAVIGFVASVVWLIVWLLMVNDKFFTFIDISEVVIVLTYLFYIPIYISIFKKRTDLNVFNRFIAPSLAIVASLIMVFASFNAHGVGNIYFIIFSAIVIGIGLIFYKPKKSYN